MKIIYLSIVLLLIPCTASAQLKYLGYIPMRCEEVESELLKIQAPENFKVSVAEAHQLASNDTIIYKCGSKLKQVIFYDDEYYYFTNEVLTAYPNWVETEAVKVHGETGEMIDAS